MSTSVGNSYLYADNIYINMKGNREICTLKKKEVTIKDI